MKKRNKKYVPLAQKIARRMSSRAGLVYEFDMQFVIEDVNRKLKEWADSNNHDDNEYYPAHIVIEAYDQQDLIIALKMQQIESPIYWKIGIDSHFYDEVNNDVKTIPFSLELPTMSHSDLMLGCDLKVNRGDGIKTRWKGLQPELIDNWETENLDGYTLIKSQVYMKAEAKFKNVDMLSKHERMLKMRDQGILIEMMGG